MLLPSPFACSSSMTGDQREVSASAPAPSNLPPLGTAPSNLPPLGEAIESAALKASPSWGRLEGAMAVPSPFAFSATSPGGMHISSLQAPYSK